ncbi:putative ribonuclease H-like domain-containing protein [Tanacetum coccineum]
MSGTQGENPPPPPPQETQQTPTQQTPHTVSTIKLPILKKGEYDIWAMKMEHYLAHTDYPIWEVIQNGNGPVSVTTDTSGQIKILPPKTAEEIVARERERKARTTLLMAIPEDHLAKFHKMTDAKEMWNAIKSRFGGNDESKKMQKYILKQQFEGFTVSNTDGIHKGYERFQSLLSQLEIHGAGVSTEDANQKFLRSLPSAWLQVSLIMRNKPGMDSLSFDDLYNNLRVFENDVKGSTASSSNLQNVAFVSKNTNSTNDEEGWMESGNKDGSRTGKKEESKALVTVGWRKINPHNTLKNKGSIDKRMIQHMTGNKAYLADFQDFNGGPVAFGGSKGYITGKGKIKTEFKNRDVIEFCGLKGIKREYSNARTPQQNGVAKRKNRTFIEAARTMLADSFLPNTFWAEAVSTACYVPYRVLVTKPHNKTPYEILTDQRIKLTFMQVNKNLTKIQAQKTKLMLGILKKKMNLLKNALNTQYGIPILQQTHLLQNQIIREEVLKRGETSHSDDLARLQRQEKEANEEAEALRKNLEQETENLVTQAGAAKSSSTNIFSTVSTTAKASGTNLVNTVSTTAKASGTNFVNTVSIPVSTASPNEGLSLSDTTNSQEDDSEIPPLEDIHEDTTDGIFTHSSYDDEGAVADFTNLETVVNVSPIPTSRINPSTPSTLIHRRSNINSFLDPKYPEKVILQGLKLCMGDSKLRACSNRKPDGIFISQDKYVAEILKKFDFASVKTASTPIETQKPLVKDEEASDVDVHLYRSMIGSLMYVTASRPDIMFAVCACSRFQVTPKTSHLSAVKRIFRYLKGKPKLGLWYPRESSFDLESYSDSDYAGANLDRKSTTGGCQFLGRRLITWQCKKQTIVATSTTEAEYVAAASCCGQVLWIQNQMLDYGFNFMNTKIYIDNESTICIVKNPVYHSKTKHIAIRHHFIRDAYEKKLIQVLKIHTNDNVADLLTKAFDVSRFQFLVVSIGMINP